MKKTYQAIKKAGVWAVDHAASVGTGVAVMAASGLASATLPASVSTTITSVQTDGQALFDLVFPVVGIFLGLTIIIKLFKRFSNKI